MRTLPAYFLQDVKQEPCLRKNQLSLATVSNCITCKEREKFALLVVDVSFTTYIPASRNDAEVNGLATEPWTLSF